MGGAVERPHANPVAAEPPVAGRLPELGAVRWRARVDEAALRRSGRLWTFTTVAHAAPFVAVAVVLAALMPLLAPVSLILLGHAWAIAELHAARGAKVVRPRPAPAEGAGARAMGFLGDLVGHEARALLAHCGLVLERGRFGVWLVGEAGALLVRPGGRTVRCYCVRTTDPQLPGGDRIAHLLLALRADEAGFATVANLAFCGAFRRVRRRLPKARREALDLARRAARSV